MCHCYHENISEASPDHKGVCVWAEASGETYLGCLGAVCNLGLPSPPTPQVWADALGRPAWSKAGHVPALIAQSGDTLQEVMEVDRTWAGRWALPSPITEPELQTWGRYAFTRSAKPSCTRVQTAPYPHRAASRQAPAGHMGGVTAPVRLDPMPRP